MVDQILHKAGVMSLLEGDELVEILEAQIAALCLNLLARGRYNIGSQARCLLRAFGVSACKNRCIRLLFFGSLHIKLNS